MKAEIHPEYHSIKATCSCGNEVAIGSTLAEDIHLDVCSSCHPFYTGKQKTIDSGGRVERFRKRFGTPHQRRKLSDLCAGAGFVQHLRCSLGI
jgi:large subunit ribosomal protein L31